MADELRLGGQVDPKLLTGVKEFQAAIRALDLLYKQNKISADDLKKSAGELGNRIKDSNVDWTKQVTLMTSLHHVQERADVGFKSMSRTLKEMYAEERVQNRTLSEMKQTIASLSSVIGGEAGRQAGTLFANFQGLEFAMQSSGMAASRAGGMLGSLGSVIAGMATPIGIAGAAFLTLNGYINSLRDETRGYLDEIDRLEGKLDKAAARRLATARAEATPGTNAGLMAFGTLFGMPSLGTVGTERAVRDAARENAALAGVKDADKKMAEEAKRNAPKAAKPGEHDYGLDFMRTRLGDRPGRLSGLGMGIQPGAAFRGSVTGGAAPTPAVMFSEAESRFMAFQTSFQSGVGAMASTLSTTIGGAFSSVFGGAHTLLGSFAGAFASTMSELAAQWVFGKLFGTALGLVTGGVGGAVTGTTLASTVGVGPSAVGGGGQGPMLAKIENAINSLELRVDNVGLYMGTRRGQLAYANR